MIKKIIIFCILLIIISGCSNNTGDGDDTNEVESIEIEVKSVSAQEFKQLIESRDIENSVILDIRTLEEYNSGHIKNAELLDYYSNSFRYELSKLDKDKTYYIYCRSGSRSGQTLSMMQDLGFTSVINLGSGINSWRSSNYEIVR